MSSQISTNCGKLKKSKLEKIFELQTDLKLSKEENALLRQQLTSMQSRCQRATVSSESLTPELLRNKEEFVKMNNAFQALKNVSITQEQSLHSLRTEVLQNRKKIKEQESLIKSLESNILTLEKNQKTLAESKSIDKSLGEQVENLQHLFFHEQRKTAKLKYALEEKDKAMESLQVRLCKTVQRRDSERSLLSRRDSEASLMRKKTSTIDRNSSDQSTSMSRQASEKSMMEVSPSTNKSRYSWDTPSTSFRSQRSTSDRSLGITSLESFNTSSRRGTDALFQSNTSASWRDDNQVVPNAMYVQRLEQELGARTLQVSELALQIKTMEKAANTKEQPKMEDSRRADFFEDDADLSDGTFW